MNTHKERVYDASIGKWRDHTEADDKWGRNVVDAVYAMEGKKRPLAPLEPTPPSQIEEEPIKSSFEQGYELGLEHGRELALKDLELLNLERQLEAINKLTKE